MRVQFAYILAALSVQFAAPAVAGGPADCLTDECRAWFDVVAPGPPANGPIGEYPTNTPPGMWQVFATPPAAPIVPRPIPGPQHFCGFMPTQQPAPGCPAGWDYWYR